MMLRICSHFVGCGVFENLCKVRRVCVERGFLDVVGFGGVAKIWMILSQHDKMAGFRVCRVDITK